MISEEAISQFSDEVQSRLREEISTYVRNGYGRRHLVLTRDGHIYYDTEAVTDEVFAIGFKIRKFDENIDSALQQKIESQIEQLLEQGHKIDEIQIAADGVVLLAPI